MFVYSSLITSKKNWFSSEKNCCYSFLSSSKKNLDSTFRTGILSVIRSGAMLFVVVVAVYWPSVIFNYCSQFRLFGFFLLLLLLFLDTYTVNISNSRKMTFRGARPSARTERPSYHFSELPYAEISVYVSADISTYRSLGHKLEGANVFTFKMGR